MNPGYPQHNMTQDSIQALRILAKLLPKISNAASLEELLEETVQVTGAVSAWIVLGEGSHAQIISAGRWHSTLQEAQQLLFHPRILRYHNAWRILSWRENFGALFYARTRSSMAQFEAGVLCKLSSGKYPDSGYLFLAFSHPLPSSLIIKKFVTIIGEKLKDYLGELIARQQAAREMQRVVTQYRILLERAPMLMTSFDANNRCLMWNNECQRVFGWTMEELNQHEDPLALFYPDPAQRRKVKASIGTTSLTDMQEYYPLRRDGAILTTLWSNILLPDNTVLNIGLDITERKKAESLLARKATIDDLTQCYNRAEILRLLEETLHNATPAQPCAIAMYDLDFFKNINDSWGHQIGDDALIHFCDHIRACADDDVMLGRLGGEEFLVIFPNTRREEAMRFADGLRVALRIAPLVAGAERITLSFSGGVEETDGSDVSVSELLTQVDRALYEAKRSGRGKTLCVCHLSPVNEADGIKADSSRIKTVTGENSF